MNHFRDFSPVNISTEMSGEIEIQPGGGIRQIDAIVLNIPKN
jgi:hypothetical protein